MRDFSDDLKALRGRVAEARGYLRVDELAARRPQLETEAARPDLWDDAEVARKVTGELASVSADLDLRFSPSVGVGFQWYETPTFNLSSEAGLAWVYEDFRNAGSDDHFAARLAYHVDWTPYKGVLLFHNLEWLPAFDDPFGDYNLNGDVGLRTTIVQGFFAEAKVEGRYDSVPAPGAEKEDLRYLLAIGWSF